MNETALEDLKYLPYTVLVRDDETNDRTHYDEAAAEEMKASIREHGILQNLGVEELPEGMFGVVWGFRRHKGVEALVAELIAAGDEESLTLAQKVAMVPVRVLSPGEAKKAKLLQTIENLQKEDVDPVDEARGYLKLLAAVNDEGVRMYPTHLALAIALGKPSKGESYIRKRLKLLDAPDFLLDALRDGLVNSVRIVEMIGAMASKKGRETMGRFAMKHPQLGIPMTTEQVKDMIAADFNESLLPALFDLQATDLLDGAQKAELGLQGSPGQDNDGSCERCLNRTGRDPLLKDELQSGTEGQRGSSGGIAPYVCQAPHCLKQKLESQWRIIESQAQESGLRVMDRAKARKLWVGSSFEGEEAARYIRKDWRPDFSCTGHHAEESMPTWGEILDGEKPSWIMVQLPKKTGFVYLFEKAEAIALAEAKWQREGGPNLFAKRAGAKKEEAAGRRQEEEAKPAEESAAVTTTVVSTVPTTPAAKDAGPTKEQIQSKYNELVLDELRSTMARPVPMVMWMAFMEDLVVNASDAAKRLMIKVLGIERNVETANSKQLREILMKDFAEGTDLYVSQNCVLLHLAQALTDGEPTLKPLLKEGLAWAEVDAGKMLETAQKALQPTPATPAEELFTCGKCGTGNFTKRGLQAHNCEKWQAKAKAVKDDGMKDLGGGMRSLPEEPEEAVYGHAEFAKLKAEPTYTVANLGAAAYNWLAVLMGQAVLKCAPNEHGVIVKVRGPEKLSWKGSKKHDGFTLQLAIHAATGLWHFAYHLENGTSSSGAGAGINWKGYDTRQEAVFEGLRLLHVKVKETANAEILIGTIAEVMLKAFPELEALVIEGPKTAPAPVKAKAAKKAAKARVPTVAATVAAGLAAEERGAEVYNADAELKERCREWRAENPGKSYGAMAAALGIDIGDAIRIGDLLIDEEFAPKIEAKHAAKVAELLEAWKKLKKPKSFSRPAVKMAYVEARDKLLGQANKLGVTLGK